MKISAGQLAFITGGASGIGLGIARALGAAGLDIAIADIDATALEAAQAELEAEGVTCMGVQLDVTNPVSWKQAADAVWARFGRIDILCNNAGIGQGARDKDAGPGLINMSEATWRLVLETNATSVFLGVREIAPRMVAVGRPGHVVNTASMAGLIAPAGLGAYAASKFAVVALSESLRAELGPMEIGVSVLCPGGVESRLSANSEARHAAYAGRSAKTVSAPGVTLMPALDVGQRVLEAIVENRMYVITHPEYLPLVEERQRAVLTGFVGVEQTAFLDPEPLLKSSRNRAYTEAVERVEGARP